MVLEPCVGLMSITVHRLSNITPKCGFIHCFCNRSALKSFICVFKWSCCLKWQKLQVGEPLQLNDALLSLLGSLLPSSALKYLHWYTPPLPWYSLSVKIAPFCSLNEKWLLQVLSVAPECYWHSGRSKMVLKLINLQLGWIKELWWHAEEKSPHLEVFRPGAFSKWLRKPSFSLQLGGLRRRITNLSKTTLFHIIGKMSKNYANSLKNWC